MISSSDRSSYLFREIEEAHGGVLIDAQHRLVDEVDGRAAMFSHPDRVALAKPVIQFGRAPASSFAALNLHRPFDGRKPSRRLLASFLSVDGVSKLPQDKGEQAA